MDVHIFGKWFAVVTYEWKEDTTKVIRDLSHTNLNGDHIKMAEVMLTPWEVRQHCPLKIIEEEMEKLARRFKPAKGRNQFNRIPGSWRKVWMGMKTMTLPYTEETNANPQPQHFDPTPTYDWEEL